MFDRQAENSPASDAEAAPARRPASPAPGGPDLAGRLMRLQATGGNQMVGRLLNSMGATNGPAAQNEATPDADAGAGSGASREGLIAQLNGLLAELPAGGVRLTTQELADLNGHLARLGSLLGRPIPLVTAGAAVGAVPGLVPVAVPTITEVLTAIAAAIAGLTLAELLLIIAAIAAIVLLIILLFRAAIRRPAPAPPAETEDETDEKKEPEKKPEEQPKPPGPVDRPIPVPPPPRAVFTPVRAPNTPAKMVDRIPDAGIVDVAVTILNWTPLVGPIGITVDGAPAQGSADFAGAPEFVVTGPAAVLPVHGAKQSPPASGTPLRLTARLGGTFPIGSSDGFAVAAIMQDMATAFSSIVDAADEVGMVVSMSWQSDGASIRSLNAVHFEEQLTLVGETGSLAGHGLGGHGDFVDADLMPVRDNHLSLRTAMSGGPGSQVIHQVWAFIDMRTNTDGVAVRNSGFRISRIIEPDPDRPGRLRLRMIKEGQAGESKGFTSGAGAGIATATIPL